MKNGGVVIHLAPPGCPYCEARAPAGRPRQLRHLGQHREDPQAEEHVKALNGQHDRSYSQHSDTHFVVADLVSRNKVKADRTPRLGSEAAKWVALR